MKSEIKSDFEKWIITKLTKEGTKYYLPIGAMKAYIYFEGQSADWSDAIVVNMKIAPVATRRISTGAKLHTGFYRWYIYAQTPIIGDKVIDVLSAIIDEQTINVSGLFRIETHVLSTFQRGNQFSGSARYETIADIDFSHWETL